MGAARNIMDLSDELHAMRPASMSRVAMQLLALTACSALTAPSIFKNPIDLNALSRRELQALANDKDPQPYTLVV